MTGSTDERREMWNTRYATEGCVWGVEPNRFVAADLEGLPPGRVLDLGCGQGRNAVWLALRGHDVLGVDLSDVAIEQARRLAADAGVSAEFVVADLATWSPEEAGFDLVLLSYLQLPAPLRRRVHRAAARALRPGGMLYLVAHHLDNLDHGVGGPPTPDVLFSEEMMADDFAELSIERNERVRRPVPAEDGAERHALDVVVVARRPLEAAAAGS